MTDKFVGSIHINIDTIFGIDLETSDPSEYWFFYINDRQYLLDYVNTDFFSNRTSVRNGIVFGQNESKLAVKCVRKGWRSFIAI